MAHLHGDTTTIAQPHYFNPSMLFFLILIYSSQFLHPLLLLRLECVALTYNIAFNFRSHSFSAFLIKGRTQIKSNWVMSLSHLGAIFSYILPIKTGLRLSKA